ncbi:MAG: hypothetical protein ACLQF4_01625 [Xanthobacteraceae bacterium]
MEVPANIAKFVSSARLPRNYEDAKKALARCDNVDEVVDWADKAAAIATYARQADDVELENYARRIRARAVRRMGELLREIDGRGGPRRKGERGSSFAPTRAAVAADAGLSVHKVRSAVSIAAIPDEDFEAAVESERPPGTVFLSQLARRPPLEVETVTGKELRAISMQHKAAAAIKALCELERNDQPGVVDELLELLADDGNVQKLPLVRAGIAFAVRIGRALDPGGGGQLVKFSERGPRRG